MKRSITIALRDFNVMQLKLKRIVFLLTLILPLTLLAQKQPIKFDRIGLDQGLSQSMVFCILKDRQGFMWFGTTDGLNKYDGYSFTVYRHDAQDSTSLSNNTVTSIYEDRAGTLWIGTTVGLNRFDREKEQFIRHVHDPKNPHGLSNNFIKVIYEDHAGTLWIGTLGGLNEFDREKAQFTHFINDQKNPNSLRGRAVLSIYEDHAGTLWVGTNGGLNRFDRDKEQFAHFINDPKNPNSPRGMSVWSIYEDHAGTLWVGTDSGLNRFDRDKEQFTHFVYDPNNPRSLSDDNVTQIYEDRAGTFWIGTPYNGLNKFDREEKQFVRFLHDPKDPNSLSNNSIISIYEDHDGTLWIGTLNGLNKFDREKVHFIRFVNDQNNSPILSNTNISFIYEDHSGAIWFGTAGGLNKFDRKKTQFTPFVHDPKNPNSLSHDQILSIYEDHTGTLWIGTWGGLNQFDREKAQFTRFIHDPKNPNSLSQNLIRSIYEDHTGTLWIGTDGGLNKFDREKAQFTRFTSDPNNAHTLSRNGISTIYEDHTGTLWIGTSGGLNKFDREKVQFTRFVNDPLNPHSLRGNWVQFVYEDHTSTLWIGTEGGLNRFDRDHDQFTYFAYDPNDPQRPNVDTIAIIYEDHNGVLWIGSDEGLNRFDRETGQFTRYTEKDGLPNNSVGGILEDSNGHLWLSRSKGLSRFDQRTKTFRNYDVSDGLQSNEFNVGACLKSQSGEMFFGGVNGFNIFHPDSIKDNPYIPPVVITAFKRYNTDTEEGKPIIEKGISAKQHITLSYKDNVLAFEFAALSYRNTSKNQYAYKLEGFKDNWIQLGTKRDVTLTNLDPGTYTLRVKGSNNDGVWNEEGTSLKITITPPWWKTWWAYTLYVMIGFGLLIMGRRYELSRARLSYQLQLEHEQAERLAEIDRMKSRFFTNISHEFRTPLTLILGPLENLLQQASSFNLREQYQIMLRNGRRLLLLINQLLDLAKLEAGSMTLRARPENIADLLRVIIASFQSLAEHKGIALHLQLPESAALENSTTYLDRDKFEKIISNLVANAIKFTPRGGSVEVAVDNGTGGTGSMNETAAAKDNKVTISVRDTGIGITANELDKIFDRFYQIEHHHQHHAQGTGIGLALTKELVQLHGGEIHVQSEVGKGSTFVVRLPVGKAHLKPGDIVGAVGGDQFSVTSDEKIEAQASSDANQATSIPQSGEAQRNPQPWPAQGRLGGATGNEAQANGAEIILIVEDNPDMRAYLREILGKHYQLIEAGDGEEGLQQAAATVPDLIVSDVMMPKMDGFAFCEKIKTDERSSHIPVILLTARASGESKIEGLKIGADDYLTKPFNAKELQVRVKNLIEQRQKLRERFSREVTLQPHDIAITTMDELFLKRIMAIVDSHLSDADFSVEAFAEEVKMSRVQLHRKIKALTNQSASDFIRTMRLRAAAKLLTQGKYTVTEVLFEVGFNSPSYFAKCFREAFGLLPSEYAALHGGRPQE